MATLTVYERETDPVFTAADAGGDSFKNDGATELLVMNLSVSSIDCVATAQRRCSHGILDHWTKSVAPGEVMRIGPYEAGRFNDASGSVSVTYTAVAGVTVAAQRQK